MNEAILNRHRKLLAQEFGDDVWRLLSSDYNVTLLEMPGLVIHDVDDRYVPIAEGKRVASLWRGSRFLETNDLGHLRILGDNNVVTEVVKFIAA